MMFPYRLAVCCLHKQKILQNIGPRLAAKDIRPMAMMKPLE